MKNRTVMQKFQAGDCSMFFHDQDCRFQIEFEIMDFDFCWADLTAEINKDNELMVEIDTEDNCYGFRRKFNCEQHALEFCNRNLSGEVKLGYLIFGLKWDQVYL